jgi:hypothetical protein
LRELDIRWIFNAAYSPNFNPIEGVISVGKGAIKKKRLNALARNEAINMEEVIENSFYAVSG